jgi:hypothetical protein
MYDRRDVATRLGGPGGNRAPGVSMTEMLTVDEHTWLEP